MKVSAQYAATHFEDILSAAGNGEEVEIAVPNKPTLKLVFAHPTALAKSMDGHPPDRPRIQRVAKGDPPVTVEFGGEWNAIDEAVWHHPERPRAELFGSLAGRIELAQDWDSPETNKQIQDLFEGSATSDAMSRN